jgi:hypothetical protein
MKYIIEPNDRYGRLTVVSEARSRKNYKMWLCLCDCGKQTIVYPQGLYKGTTQSCGCLGRERRLAANTKHGHNLRGNKSGEHRSWWEMLRRCYSPRHISFKNYGGRGIAVCERWRNGFQAFFADMGPKPTTRHWLDRKDTNGDYTPDNCRWATPKEQLRNTRRNRIVTYKDRQVCVSQLAEETGVSEKRLRWRIKHGWTVERAVSAG